MPRIANEASPESARSASCWAAFKAFAFRSNRVAPVIHYSRRPGPRAVGLHSFDIQIFDEEDERLSAANTALPGGSPTDEILEALSSSSDDGEVSEAEEVVLPDMVTACMGCRRSFSFLSDITEERCSSPDEGEASGAEEMC